MASLQIQRQSLRRSSSCTSSRRPSLRALATAAPAVDMQLRPSKLVEWMEVNGAPQPKVTLKTVEREGRTIDVTVAAEPLAPGDLALRLPDRLVVTLDRVLEDSTMSELLSNGKLSELAILALHLCYEKKLGTDSHWHALIKELDRMAGRGPQGAKTPLLWTEEEVATLLAGSPVQQEVAERLAGIQREYQELDTVWWMAGSLFNRYQMEIPTEQFSFKVFKEAFAAIQASVVHLTQGAPPGKRFALVPLGPPLLGYSSTCKAFFKYDAAAGEVQLAVDRPCAPGEPLVAWCGPQPNSKLLLNYGIVDEANPFDRLPLEVVIPSSDPLYRLKRDRLAEAGLSTQQAFQLLRGRPLPPQLLPYLRLTAAASEEEAWKVVLTGPEAGPVGEGNERLVLAQLADHLRRRLALYRTSVKEDEATIADPSSGPRRTVAARLTRIEKIILQQALEQVLAMPGAAEAAAGPPPAGSPIQLGGGGADAHCG